MIIYHRNIWYVWNNSFWDNQSRSRQIFSLTKFSKKSLFLCIAYFLPNLSQYLIPSGMHPKLLDMPYSIFCKHYELCYKHTTTTSNLSIFITNEYIAKLDSSSAGQTELALLPYNATEPAKLILHSSCILSFLHELRPAIDKSDNKLRLYS